MATVVRITSISTDLVAIEARKAIEDTEETDPHGTDDTANNQDGALDPELAETTSDGAKVISLHTRRLPADARPALPDMSKYDRLLLPVKNNSTRKGTSA
ncbi:MULTISPECIES: hypothetical protein [Streptomyces]|uniref:hypothetical protein n=1 Tax=Streptomyces TaxID=1883 RepID=UPI002F9275A4